MRKLLIVGNWKMHTHAADAIRLAKALVDGFVGDPNVSVAVSPPFPYLTLVRDIFKETHITLGAQNFFPAADGAVTGEVSPTMLLDVGCKYVIVGHSERRQILGESDQFISQKLKIALSVGLNAILCIGETLDQRLSGQTESIIQSQLSKGLSGLQVEHLRYLHIAYEPIWAIGSSGHHATPEQVGQAHAIVRRRFQKMFGERPAQALCIQYGGNVNPENATELLSTPGVDGALIGAASLNADQFLSIIRAAIRVKKAEMDLLVV